MDILQSKDLADLDADALRALVLNQQRKLLDADKLIKEKELKLNSQNHLVVERKKLLDDIKFKEAVISKLTHEIAVLRRFRFGKKSEQLHGVQRSLLEDAVDADIAAIETELENLQSKEPKQQETKQKPKRKPLPESLPRIEIHHEPHDKTCTCGCLLTRIGEDVSEKLDYIPGVARVERHIRGKWACNGCEILTQAPVPAHVIDKGIATTGLLSHVLVAKYLDHLPLYRQEQIFERAGVKIPRSTMAQWVGTCGVRLQPLVDALRDYVLEHDVLHADETPVTMLRPDTGKTVHKAYLWAYATTAYEDKKAVIYEFKASRAGQHAREFLEGWHGSLVVDDYKGYKKGFAENGITEAGCWAHARRKFYDLFIANKSQVAEQALEYIGLLYDIERDINQLDKDKRWRARQDRAKPLIDKYYLWLQVQRVKAPNGSGLAKAIDYSLKRWDALVLYLDDGAVPIDNNHIERQIKPVAVGKKNWLFAGSLRGGERAAAVMTLIQSAKLNGHDPYAYMKDVLTKLPTWPNKRIEELLPHNWGPELDS